MKKKKGFNWRAASIVVIVILCGVVAAIPMVRAQTQQDAGAATAPDRRQDQPMQATMHKAAQRSKQAVKTVADSEKEKKKKNAEARKASELKKNKQARVNETRKRQVITSGNGTPIMGESSVSADQMASLYKRRASYPAKALKKGGADSIEVFCDIIVEEAETEGVRADVVFAQAMLETGWLKFGGADSISQYNFAGLGTVGNGKPGNSFPDVRTGIRAQVQHLKAYATTDALTGELVDQRFDQVRRGCAPYIEWLGMQENPSGRGWAGGSEYGKKILKIIADSQSL